MVRVGGGWDELEHFLSKRDAEKVGKVLLCKYRALKFQFTQFRAL